MKKNSIEDIKKMSYTDFVGLINQWNVLPGSYNTLSKWLVFSKLNKKSNLLEVACTTGFSSRELSLFSGCRGLGFDISKKSIDMAKYNKKIYAPNTNLIYEKKDGYKFNTESKFTHIVVGASLGFFENPQKMMDKCVSLLSDNGMILASPFFVKKKIPKHLIERAKKVFGITPTNISYKEVMKLYNKLEIVFEERNYLVKETKEELDYYCKCTIDRACAMIGINDKKIYNEMYKRLYQIKAMSNDLRPYQMYSVLVLRYRKNVYPNRFVELF